MKYFSELIRTKISGMVGLASFAGACLFNRHVGLDHVYALFAALFLSAGCSALNQYQERDRDGMMARTSGRPLPVGNLMPDEVIRIAVSLIMLGFCFVLLTDSVSALVISVVTVAGYNFVYTPAKSITPFSVMIGSVPGALPPILGFCCAGGSPIDSRIVTVTVVLYLWQTPHFALLAEKYAEDYARAGFKTLKGSYGEEKSRLFINVWAMAYIASLFFVPMSGIYRSAASSVIHVSIIALLALLTFIIRGRRQFYFHFLNISAVLFFILITSDSLFKF